MCIRDSSSEGERQLLCIARVMLMKPPMLILDEATSSIDTRTELKVQDAFNTLMQGRTSFVVAHRLSTIRHADCIQMCIRDSYLTLRKYCWYWTSSPVLTNQSSVTAVTTTGGFYKTLAADELCGVCPAMYLRSGILVLCGSGTAENPYALAGGGER